MLIFPAIDLKDGRCVRLRQGRADDATVYGDDPVKMAMRWAAEGAEALHVVDLDGAFEGKPRHTELIGEMAAACGLPVQVGGGLRGDEDIRKLLDAGVWRVIIGTRALSSPEEVKDLIGRFGEKIVVGIDARDGWVQTRGWVETTGVRAVDLALQADAWGVSTIIYTDTATDGMLSGPNLGAVGELCDAVDGRVIASGGVSRSPDVTALIALGKENLVGVIVGKALYSGNVTLADLLSAARPGH